MVLKSFVLLIFFATVLVFWSKKSESVKVSASEKGLVLSKTPRDLFINNCARCHGANGNAQTETGKLYNTPNISGGKLRKSSNKRLTRIITNGYGSMPAFGKKLSKADIAALVGYVRRL